MKLTIKAESLKEPLKLIKDFVYEANIRTTDEGLQLICWNKANAGMVIYKVSKTLFTEYIPSEETMGIRLGGTTINGKKMHGLTTLIKKAKDGSFITIEEEKGRLTVIVNGRKYGMGILADLETKESVPDIKFKTVFNIETEKLSELINDGFLDSEESMLFVLKDKKLIVSYDKDIDTMEDSLEVSEVIEGEVSKCRYSISYLRQIISTITDKVRVSFGTDDPLRLDYITPEFELSFILAPRVENT